MFLSSWLFAAPISAGQAGFGSLRVRSFKEHGPAYSRWRAMQLPCFSSTCTRMGTSHPTHGASPYYPVSQSCLFQAAMRGSWTRPKDPFMFESMFQACASSRRVGTRDIYIYILALAWNRGEPLPPPKKKRRKGRKTKAAILGWILRGQPCSPIDCTPSNVRGFEGPPLVVGCSLPQFN